MSFDPDMNHNEDYTILKSSPKITNTRNMGLRVDSQKNNISQAKLKLLNLLNEKEERNLGPGQIKVINESLDNATTAI